ncbi:hypothetical protein L204_105925 [Cryptococcus depauperatus]
MMSDIPNSSACIMISDLQYQAKVLNDIEEVEEEGEVLSTTQDNSPTHSEEEIKDETLIAAVSADPSHCTTATSSIENDLEKRAVSLSNTHSSSSSCVVVDDDFSDFAKSIRAQQTLLYRASLVPPRHETHDQNQRKSLRRRRMLQIGAVVLMTGVATGFGVGIWAINKDQKANAY